MPILAPGRVHVDSGGPYAPGTHTVLATRSPFWLRVNETWVHLEGVTPGASRSAERPSSELITVDGVRHVQRAPRAPREWSLDFTHATAEAVALLGLAAEVDDVWLLDETAAQANMLAPRDCYGHDPADPVLDCGGVPLRALPLNVNVEVTTPVRGGVSLIVSAWTGLHPNGLIGDIVAPGAAESLYATSDTGTRRSEVVVTPDADGDLTLTVYGDDTNYTSGLGVAEIHEPAPFHPPLRWIAGERTPCMVAVADPERTLDRITGGVGYGSYSVTMREVG